MEDEFAMADLQPSTFAFNQSDEKKNHLTT